MMGSATEVGTSKAVAKQAANPTPPVAKIAARRAVTPNATFDSRVSLGHFRRKMAWKGQFEELSLENSRDYVKFLVLLAVYYNFLIDRYNV